MTGTKPVRPEAWLAPAAARAPNSAPAQVVAVGGDGVGPEVVAAALECVRALDTPVEIAQPVCGAASVAAGGVAFPDELRAALDGADAVLFGAVDTGPRGYCRPILRYLRFQTGIYANLRPTTSLPGVPALTGRGGTDLVIVRELSEGLYPGCEGATDELLRGLPGLADVLGRPVPAGARFALQVVSENASLRIARYAARLATWRRDQGIGRGHVTIVTKANVLAQSDGWFRDLCVHVIEDTGELTWDHVHVDEAARRLVARPEQFDVIVTTNLYGDILSDVAAEAMGGLPMAPSAGVGDARAYFESCHGSAPDIAGQDLVNPIATIFSAAMMLAYLGLDSDARRLVAAALATLNAGTRPRDLGGTASTRAFADAVCAHLARL